MPPAIVSISSLEYSGNLDLNVAKEKLTTFINSITNGELQKSDLINVLSNAGATSVSTSITLTIKQYTSDFSNTTYNLTGDTYQLPSSDISRFFATSETLNGVTIV